MKILKLIFLAMAAYGFVTPHHGAGLLALGMAVFVHWAEWVMDAHDAAWAADPHNAKRVQCSTSDALCEHECECMRGTH